MKCPGANHPAGAGAGQGHGDRCGDIDSMTYNCPGSRHIHTPHHSHYHVVIHLAATTKLIPIFISRCLTSWPYFGVKLRKKLPIVTLR